MKNIPRFLRGFFRNTFRLALREITPSQGDQMRSARGWELLMLFPRLLLFRPRRGKQKLSQRFQDFARGQWGQLLDACRSSAEISYKVRHRQRQRCRDRTQDIAKRAAKVSMMVQLGELSSARQALQGADLAPGTPATLAALRNPARRPKRPLDPIPRALMVPNDFELDEGRFGKNLRSSKRSAAGGPSSMTTEHLRPLLDSSRDTHLLFDACQR